jgi:hypothetical protein
MHEAFADFNSAPGSQYPANGLSANLRARPLHGCHMAAAVGDQKRAAMSWLRDANRLG